MTIALILVGLVLLLFTGLPIFAGLTLFGGMLLVATQGGLGSISEIIFGELNRYLLVAIPLFAFMAHVMIKSRIVDDLYGTAYTLTRHLPGGVGIATIAACTLFAAISGSSVATALTIGSVAIPQMIRFGYQPRAAYGLVAAGGTLGILIPPSGPMVLYGVVTDSSIGGLFMAYQPIVRTLDGSVFGWEALLRTKEPAVTGPLAFLETAERLGRVEELGRLIRASVARTANQRRGTVFFVNLHPDDLLDEALFDAYSPLSVLAPEIVLEITEQSPFDTVPDVRDRVRRLRSLGFRLAVDDLGSRYAGLTSFAALEPEFVKLDRGLVQGIDSEPVKRKLVGSIVTVSRELGITVVAEGIETAAERAVVAGLGCDLMQGFFFRHPEPWREEDGLSLSAEGSPCPPQSVS